MERALITGGTGFVGGHLIPLLQNTGIKVAVLASLKSKSLPAVEWYEADVRDPEKVRSAIHDFRPQYLYHLAALSSVDFSWKNPRLTYEVNVFGTLNVFEAAMTLPSPPRILNVSSGQVYAPKSSCLSEDSPAAPDNPYSASKAMAELLSCQYRDSSGGGVITTRSFNHTGPGQSEKFVLSSIAKQFIEIETGLRQPKLILGNVHVRRDFTDVRDVVRAYSLLLRKGKVGQIYNVSSGRARSIDSIIRQFEAISGQHVQIEVDQSKLRAAEADLICGNSQKLRDATEWQPQIPWTTTLQDLLAHWRDTERENLCRSTEAAA